MANMDSEDNAQYFDEQASSAGLNIAPGKSGALI
jgi:hypothetical protein